MSALAGAVWEPHLLVLRPCAAETGDDLSVRTIPIITAIDRLVRWLRPPGPRCIDGWLFADGNNVSLVTAPPANPNRRRRMGRMASAIVRIRFGRQAFLCRLARIAAAVRRVGGSR